LSLDEEASRRPSGLHAHIHTVSSWPRSVAVTDHVSQAHTRTVGSSDVDASRVPSGLHAHESTAFKWPTNLTNSRPLRRVIHNKHMTEIGRILLYNIVHRAPRRITW